MKHVKDIVVNPLREFTFFENRIKIMFYDKTAGSHAGIILTYKYNKEKNNWYLELVFRRRQRHDLKGKMLK